MKRIVHQQPSPTARCHPASEPALEPHPLAACFPPMSDNEFAELVADIDEHGQRRPVRLYDGRILDGHHRAKALRQLGKGIAVVDFVGILEEAADFVISENAMRRHLKPMDRAKAVLAARKIAGQPEPSVRELASAAGIGQGTAQRAKTPPEGVPNGTDRDGETPQSQAERERQSNGREPARATVDPNEDDDEPEELSRLESLQLDLDIERKNVKELRADLEAAERRARMIEDADNPELAIRLREINNINAENRSLKQQLAEWQTKTGDAQREAKMWRKRAMALGWSK